MPATLVQITRKPTQVKERLVYRVWLRTGHALGNDLINPSRNVTIYVEWNVKQSGEKRFLAYVDAQSDILTVCGGKLLVRFADGRPRSGQ